MRYQHVEDLEDSDGGSKPPMLFGYLALSLCAGVAIWAAIFSVPLVKSGMEPVDIASAVFGIERPIDDPMILARDSELFLIEPAAGPANGCE